MEADLSLLSDEEIEKQLAELEDDTDDITTLSDEELDAQLSALEDTAPETSVPASDSREDAISAAADLPYPANPDVEPIPVQQDTGGPVLDSTDLQTAEMLDDEAIASATMPSEEKQAINAAPMLEALQDNAPPEAIIEYLFTAGIDTFDIDGTTYDFKKAFEDGTPPQEILNVLMTGEFVRDISPMQTSALALGNAAVTTLGLPVDLLSLLSEAGKKGANFLASLNAPEGVDDPDSPNYDPDFYFQPYQRKSLPSLFSDDVDEDVSYPLGGSQSIREGLRKLGIDLPDSVREIPEDLRATYQFNRVFGENIGFAAALYRASLKAGTKLATSPTMHPVLRSMAENPKAVLNSEALALLGASSGAAFMQKQYPNNPYGQLIGELAGGFGFTLAPATVKTILNNAPVLQLGKNAVDRIISGTTTEGGRNGAAQDLIILAEEFRQGLKNQADQARADGNIAEAERLEAQSKEYEVETFLGKLNALDASSSALPAGTATDSEVLVGAQNYLLNGSDQFKTRVSQQISESLAGIEALSRKLLQGEGTAQLGELMQSRYVQAILQAEYKSRSSRMLEILKAIPEGNVEQAGLAIQGLLREGKTNLRAMETFWWERVDPTVQVNPEGIARTIEAQRDKLPSAAPIADGDVTPNQVLSSMIGRAERGEAVSVGEVLKFRSYFLNKARMAGSGPTPDLKTADIYDEIAASAVELLNNVKGYKSQDIKMARKFSAALNEKYNRFWVKSTLERAGSGGFSNDPRLAAESATNGSLLQKNVNLRDAGEAADFADVAAIGTVQQQTDDALEAGARQAAADVNPVKADPSLDRDGLIEGPDTPSMSEALKAFWDRTPVYPMERMRVADTPKSKDEAIIANADGATVFTPETKPFKQNETPPPPPEDVYEGEGIFSLDNEQLYGELDVPPEIKPLGPRMSAEQETMLLGEIRKLRDNSIRDSIPTEQALNTWLDDNKELLNRFPQVKQIAEDLLAASEEAAGYAAKVDNFKDTENFNTAVAEVFNGKNPDQDYSNLVKVIKDAAVAQRRSPEEVKTAMDHLRASTFDLMLGASMKDGEIDFLALTQQLFAPVDTNATKGTTRIEIMQKNGLIDQDSVEAVGLLLNEAVRIQKTTETGTQFNTVLSQSAAMLDNLARIAGANVGVLGGSGQASLQTAAIGSQFFKNLVNKFPAGNRRKQMEILFLNPKLLADYISKNKKVQKRAATVIQEGFNNIKNKYRDQGVVRTTGGLLWDGTKYVANQVAGIGKQSYDRSQPSMASNTLYGVTGDDSELDAQMLELGVQ